jgi:serine protease DegQ
MPRALAILATAITLSILAASSLAKSPPQQLAPSKLKAANSLAPMLKRVMPSVVAVLTSGERAAPVTVGPVTVESSGSQKVQAVEAPQVKEPFRSGGSGVIVDAEKGIIVTNHHVVANATRVDIALLDGRIVEAKLLGSDPGTDIAVVQIPLKGLTAVPLGNSDLQVGDFIAVAGNPYGLEGSATQGIVSAVMRSDIGYEIFEDFIQIDAAVNPGNSGGALVDIDGRLVGMPTASGAAKLGTQGISFAIPVNIVRSVAGELIGKGHFKHGGLGIVAENLNFETARQLHLPVTRGAAVTFVFPGTPAAEAGVKKGDVIIAINGKAVRTASDYIANVATTPIGQKLAIQFLSGGMRKELTLAVADIAVTPMAEAPPMGLTSLDGLTLGALLPGFKAFGLVQGARVLSTGTGSLANSGLNVDDVITKVDTSVVRTPKDFFDAARSKMGRYRLEVLRDGKILWIWLAS